METYIRGEMSFWSGIIGYASGINSTLSAIRNGQFYPFLRGYVFSAKEFDQMFRFAAEQGTDPVQLFGLQPLIDNQVLGTSVNYLAMNDEHRMLAQNLINRFRTYLGAQREPRGITIYEFPISVLQFHFITYPTMILRGLFRGGLPAQLSPAMQEKTRIASRFWRLVILGWFVWNAFIFAATIYFGWASLPALGIVGGILLILLNMRMSFRAFASIGLSAMHRNIVRVMGYNRIRSMADAREYLPTLLLTSEGRTFYETTVEWLRNGPQGAWISEEVYRELQAIETNPNLAANLERVSPGCIT